MADDRYMIKATRIDSGVTDAVDLLAIYVQGTPIPESQRFGGDTVREATFKTNAQAIDVMAELVASPAFAKVYDPTTYSIVHTHS